MPIYEYLCQECGDRSETLQSLNEPPLTECSACGGELRKLLSAPAFQFKGTGWYVTDYAKKDKGGDEPEKKSEESGSSSDSSSDSNSDSSSDSTSSSKSESSSKESASKSA